MSCSELIEIQHTNIPQPFSTWYCNNFKPMAGCPCWYRACRTLCTQSLWKGTCLDDSSSSLPLSLRQLRAKSRTAKPLELQGKEKRWDAASSRKVLFVCAGLRSWTASKGLHWLCAPKGILIYCVEGFITKDHHLSEAEIVKQKRSKEPNLSKNFKIPRFNALGSLCYRLLPKRFTKGIQGLKSSSAQDPCTFGFLAQNGLWMVPQTHHGTLKSLNSLNDV